MGLYLNGSPPKREPRPRLHRLVEMGTMDVVAVSPGFHVESVHFWQRKRWQHREPRADCVGCANGRRLVSYGYLACWINAERDFGVVEVTQRAMELFVRDAERSGLETLRGRRLTIHRGKGGRTARQWIDGHLSLAPTEFSREPPAIDVGGLLAFLYMQQGRLSFGGDLQ